MSLATVVDGRTLLLARLDVGHNAVVLLLRDLGTLVDTLVEGVANLDVLGPLGEALKEFVVDAGLDEDTRAGAACLTVVPAKERLEKAYGDWRNTYKIP